MITPAPRQSRAGNRTTAVRWAGLLRSLGHRVTVALNYGREACDMMVALHAWRSAEAIQQFSQLYPDRPLIVALTGTDLYSFIRTHPATTLRSMKLADRLVTLHAAVDNDVPAHLHHKIRPILQSAKPLRRRLKPSRRTFDVCIVGHLRDVKDPLRTAMAVRDLPPTSRIRVIHVGKAHDDSWAAKARVAMHESPRYQWRGEVPQWKVRELYEKSRLLVLSSKLEGGANVVSEAVVAGLPVIASAIPGSIGLLGADYAGYYPVGDTAALRELLRRAEAEPSFYRELKRQCRARAPLFRPQKEKAAWRALLREFPHPSS